MALGHNPGAIEEERDGANSASSVATSLFFIWSVLTFIVRAWVKLRRRDSWGWDDTAISAALVVALLHVISIFWSINAGNGVPVTSLASDNSAIVEKSLYAGQILYLSSVGLTRISTGFFIARLTRHGRQMQIAHALTALCGVWMITSILLICLRGDLSQPWSILDGSQTLFARWIGVESSGLAMELVFWIFCIHIIWSLSMPVLRRFLVLIIFGCRLLLIPIVALRLSYLSPQQNLVPGSTNMTANILTEGVLNFALMSACVTSFRPFLQPFHMEYVVSAAATGSNTWPSAAGSKSREAYYKLSAGGDSNTQRSIPKVVVRDVTSYELEENTKRHMKKVSGSNGRMFRPDRFDQFATISSNSFSTTLHHDLGFDEGIIKTESWSVRFEEDHEPSGRKSQVGFAM